MDDEEPPPPEMMDLKIFKLSTSTEDIARTVMSLFDSAVDTVQGIPRIELPYSMEEAFAIRMHNGGVMPEIPLDAPQPDWEQVKSKREHIDTTIQAAMKPIDDFVALFEPYIEFLNVDLAAFLAETKEQDPKHDVIRAEVISHRQQAQVRQGSAPCASCTRESRRHSRLQRRTSPSP